MSTVADVAHIWQQAGVSVIPILANGAKRPALSWSPYQVTLPTSSEVEKWFTGGQHGLALICGGVSGGLEMTEIEGRALAKPDMWETLNVRMEQLGGGSVWDLLTGPDGYMEGSPTGGVHLLYRITDAPVPGNTKIAADEDRMVLAETRGDGGYVIVAPSAGDCHPSGKPWVLVSGDYGKLPQLTWTQRNLLHDCLRSALDRTPPPPNLPVVIPSSEGRTVSVGHLDDLSPGDDFEQQTDWAKILEPHGWRMTMAMSDGERHWVRPGKDARDGMSATTGRANDRDRLYVFSTSTVFQAEVPYTKFGAYALLNFNGNHGLAASHLRVTGYGERRNVVDTKDLGEWVPPLEEPAIYTQDDLGNGQRLADKVRGRYRRIWQDQEFYCWDSTTWVPDVHNGLLREWTAVTNDMEVENKKWAKTCRAYSRFKAAQYVASSQVSHSASEWDPDPNLINVQNGVLNLATRDLYPHDPKYLMTKTLAARFQPNTHCPNFEEFIHSVLPDQDMRTYVQRALGYTLLGDSDQRSIFLIYGPSGTGKSTLIETVRTVFGDYGSAAGPGAFRQNTNPNAPSQDLHMLMGSRMVTASETSESASFDEELLKHLSGREVVVSRPLYGKPVQWSPKCVLWIITNTPPKLNSDDNAIWKRVKFIPFTTVFLGPREIFDYSRKHLVPEAPGILNWLLDGLSAFHADGLNEPPEVTALAEEHRMDNDSVGRYVKDRCADGRMTLSAELQVQALVLYNDYSAWCTEVKERPLGARRFNLRLPYAVTGIERVEGSGRPSWNGISISSSWSRPELSWQGN